MEELKLREKISKVIKLLKRNKGAAYILAAVFCCVLAVSGLLLFMPKGYAEKFTGYGDGTSLENPMELKLSKGSNGNPNRWSATLSENNSGGKYYLLDGEGVNLNSGIDITISAGGTSDSDGYHDVYLTLKDVNMNLTTDVSGIAFQFSEPDTRYEPLGSKNVFDKDLLNKNKVRVHIYLMGESSIKGAAGAQSPLIEAENYNFVTETYYSSGTGKGAMGSFMYYSQHIELIIESANKSGYRDSLTLTTGQGSYGAAIGGRGGNPIKKKLEEIGISEEAYKNISNYLKKDEIIADLQYYTRGTFLVDLKPYGVPSLECGAAKVTIKSGVVNIEGNGYGAGIGNGGCKDSEAKMVTFYTLYNEIVAAPAQSNTSSVRIEDGTVSVIMNESSKGSCFVNGAEGEKVAEDGRVTIMGGSVYLKRQGKVAEGKTPYDSAFNDKGDKLYAFAAHYNEDAGKVYAEKNNVIGENIDLDNICNTENEEYQYVIRRLIDTDGKDSYTGNKLKYLSTYVNMSLSAGYDDNKYKFTGFGYNNGDENLYFYLPADKLPQYGLTITDNVGNNDRINPQYDVAVLNEEQIKATDEWKNYQYIPYGTDSFIKETKYVLVKISGEIPSYCTGIKYTYNQTNGGSSESNADVIKKDDGWYISTKMVAGDMTIKFVYTVGSYTINYNYGLLDADKKEEGSIVNRNEKSVECGTEYTLKDASWEGRTFAGWYSNENFTGDRIVSVTSDNLNETINLYAKWTCDVIYHTEIGRFLNTVKSSFNLDYGTEFDFMSIDNCPGIDNIDLGESFDLVEFIGWEYNGKTYNEDAPLSDETRITVSKNTDITARFNKKGYLVYVTAAYGDSNEHRDIKNYLEDSLDAFRMDFPEAEGVRNLISDSYTGDYYYQSTVLLNSEDVIMTLVPKAGYKISGISLTDADGNVINLAGDISLNEKNQFKFSMNGINKDLYIVVNFDMEQYSITYYDIINNNSYLIDDSQNPATYTINSEDITFTRPKTERDKYWKFMGFKEMGKDEIISGIPQGSRTGNLTLIAQWEEVKVYNININDGVGIIKAYVDGVEMTRAAEGETVTLTATVNPGIRLKRIEYRWEAETDHDTIESYKYNNVTNTTVEITFTMPATDIEVNGEFEIIEYVITYLNLNGARNDNPSIYTVFDSFDLAAPIKEGRTFKGWRLIVPNDDTVDDVTDVKMIDIDKIENCTGNLMLYADWEEGDDISAVYHAYVDSGIVNGQVELTKTEAVRNEWVFVRVSENEGYQLSALVYTPEISSARLRVSPLERYAQRSVAVDISLNQVSDGLYYFVMPDSDVEITAVFEPVTYNISYIANGGKHTNVDSYTIEDDIVLEDAVKSGFIFSGWYDEKGEKVEKLHYATGNKVLSARWMTAIENNTGDGNNNEGNGNNGDDGSNGDDGNHSENGSNGTSDTNQNKPAVEDKPNVDVEEKPNTYVTGNIQTGDSVDVTRLIIICVLCGAVLLLLVIPKKKKQDEEENENKEENVNKEDAKKR